MKKKTILIITSVLLAGAITVSMCGCGLFGGADSTAKNPYEVAGELGYTGTNAEWLSSVTGSGTEARALYEEAKKDGYTGTFVEFLKEIGAAKSDDSTGINSAVMSVVSIWCTFTETTYSGLVRPGSSQEKTVSSAGSGVIYSMDKTAGNAYVITNYHVVYNGESNGRETTPHISDDIKLYLYGGQTANGAISASYVGGAMDYDIAVLKIENSTVLKNSDAMTVTLSDSDAVTLGERVYAIGNPEGDGISVSGGVVSVDAEYIDIKSADGSKTLSLLEIRTDASVNHGNSGGGLFNADGKLVGIVNAKTEEDGVEGLGYAIPVNLAASIAQNIIDNAGANSSKGALRATLGVTVQTEGSVAVFDEKTQKAYIMETVVVKDVTVSGVANGKLKTGDVLYSVKIVKDGKTVRDKTVTRMHNLGNLLFDVRLGDTVEITVMRDEKQVIVEIPFNNAQQFTVFA